MALTNERCICSVFGWFELKSGSFICSITLKPVWPAVVNFQTVHERNHTSNQTIPIAQTMPILHRLAEVELPAGTTN